jgi:hypothetical protein
MQVQHGDGCAVCCPRELGSLARGGGWLRQQCLRVCKHAYFDQFIMVCILVNCVFLAIADPTTAVESPVEQVSGTIFLYIFTLECTCKLTA